MHQRLRKTLQSLQALDPARGLEQAARCKICHSVAPIFDVVDLQKHCSFDNQYQYGLSGVQVPYFSCRRCGFLFATFFDDWTKRDWSRFVYNADYAKVDPEYEGARPERLARTMADTLRGCGGLRILDYGSGSGMFARCMHALGYQRVESYDPFSCPAKPEGRFDLVTCFEVLEHTLSPRDALREIKGYLSPGGCIVFSQSVQPLDIHTIRGAWWYLAPRNGHVSTFTVQTLLRILPSETHRLHGNGWLWAMVPQNPDPRLAPMIARIGARVTSLCLHAPGFGQDDQWHAPEPSANGELRWSYSDSLEWVIDPPSSYPALFHVRIPFQLEAYPGFAAACRVSIGQLSARTLASGSEIRAEVLANVPLTAPAVTLHTPPPRSPFELRRAPDARLLGLRLFTE